jgi:S-adenosylmethionine:tRNA-ribosyltransferase-isomerase (queuine synthetase)
MGGVQPWTVKAMSNLKPIYVTLKEGRHKTQPWTFTIDRPGPQKGETKRERYVSMWSAKRGACRVLGAKLHFDELIDDVDLGVKEAKTGRIRRVKFIVHRLPKKK